MVISHLISLNSASINTGSFVEQKHRSLGADKELFLCHKAELTGRSSWDPRGAEAERWSFRAPRGSTRPFAKNQTRRQGRARRPLPGSRARPKAQSAKHPAWGIPGEQRAGGRFYDTTAKHRLKRHDFLNILGLLPPSCSTAPPLTREWVWRRSTGRATRGPPAEAPGRALQR